MQTIDASKLWLLFFPLFFLSTQSLDLPEKTFNLFKGITIVASFSQLGFWISSFINFGIERFGNKIFNDIEPNASKANVLNLITTGGLWLIMILMSLANLGVNIIALIAGLGIGGVAIALALQNILSDLFASLSIVLDKPFVIGDFIAVDEFKGTVEHIGLKTTLIRSLEGEQIVFSNNDLLKARLRNYKRMYERRASFHFGVSYNTSLKNLKEIPLFVRNIIEEIENTRFDRAHFSKIGNSSFQFEVVYWVISPEYKFYMDIQQNINFELINIFEKENIKLAFPTRTIKIERE